MNTPPASIELATGLRAGAAGSYASEAATELLIRHEFWLHRPDFITTCLDVDEAGEFVGVSWAEVARHVCEVDVEPSARAVALIAAQLGGYPEPGERPVDIAAMPPLAWLLAGLQRGDVDMVLAAVSHAAGTHDHVEFLLEPSESGEERPTRTSPRLRLGPLHPWPDGALA